MDRCYKLKVLIIVLTCVLIPTSLIYSNELVYLQVGTGSFTF